MFQVMLVDDESLIREPLKKMIIDSKLPLKVVAEASHAKEALKMINAIKPHIIITDMKMPQSDGMMLMEEIHQAKLLIKIIVISGYANFEYMKKAIATNVVDYLLKPVTLPDLTATLEKVIQAIEEEKSKHTNYVDLKRDKEIFLQNLCGSRIMNTNNISAEAKKFHINPSSSYCFILLAFKNLHEVAQERFYGNIELMINEIQHTIDGEVHVGHVFKTDDRTKICILYPLEALESIDQVIHSLFSTIENQLNMSMMAGVSLLFHYLVDANTYFKQAMEALHHNPLQTYHSFFVFIDKPIEKESIRIGDEDIKILSRAIISRNTHDIKNAIKRIIMAAKIHPLITFRDIHQLYHRIIVEIKSSLGSFEVHDVDTISPYMDIQYIKDILSFPQFTKSLHMISDHLIKIIDSDRISDMTTTVKEVQAYINEHYNEDISLVDLAYRYHFEPTYFSKMFKSIMNIGFMEYIISLRMDKACDFLKNSTLQVNDISSMVGYENQRYFSQIFKKFTGYTPTQYRSLQEERAR